MGSWTVAAPASGVVLHLASTARGICGISFVQSTPEFLLQLANTTGNEEWERDRDPLLVEAVHQIEEYFSGDRKEFQLALDLRGTLFQQRVWQALQEIPYGQTRSYVDIARLLGSPGAARAVGAANGSNPVAIVVPCHRVVASGGGLGGYGGGLELKRRLLALESGSKPLLNLF